jgi:hypothetical protein
MTPTTNPGRFAGVLYVLTSIFGFFAMDYVPSKLIVHGNATATASNISASETLFRLSVASQLIGAAGFIFVAVALYDLLKRVNQRHAWLMVFLRSGRSGRAAKKAKRGDCGVASETPQTQDHMSQQCPRFALLIATLPAQASGFRTRTSASWF